MNRNNKHRRKIKENVLAVNKAHETEMYDWWSTLRGRGCAFGALCLIILTLVELNIGEGVGLIIIPALTAVMIPLSIMAIDRDMRWHCAVETIAVRDEMLVIECRRCILKRKREIPLSAIKDVEYYDDYSGWRPETLYLVYSNTGYKFGLCMADSEREALAEKITEVIRQYV